MNLKPLEDKLVALLGPVEGVAVAIPALLAQTPQFITLADEAVKFVDDGVAALKGSDKLALVKAMAQAALTELNPSLLTQFTSIWGLLGPVITLIVQLRKLGFIKF